MATVKQIPNYLIELSDEEAQGLRTLLGRGVLMDTLDNLKLTDLYNSLIKEMKDPSIDGFRFIQIASGRKETK